MDIKPEYANLKMDGRVESVMPEEVNIDDIIIRWIKFKKSGKKIYVYSAEEETKDGQ